MRELAEEELVIGWIVSDALETERPEFDSGSGVEFTLELHPRRSIERGIKTHEFELGSLCYTFCVALLTSEDEECEGKPTFLPW